MDQLEELHKALQTETFYCRNEKCEHGFNPLAASSVNAEKRLETAKRLFGGISQDND